MASARSSCAPEVNKSSSAFAVGTEQTFNEYLLRCLPPS